MRAIILAAGRGTRLAPIELVVPKPMVRIGGIPVLEHTIQHMDASGVRDITITVGHKKEIITDYFGDGRAFGVRITYSAEGENDNFGTAGGVKRAAKLRDNTAEPFIVWHGDNFSTCRLDRLLESHIQSRAEVTLTAVWRSDVTHSGALAWDSANRVVHFKEKPKGSIHGGWINAGIYMLNPSVVNDLPDEGDLSRDVFPKLIQEDRKIFVHGFSYDETFRWYDTPEDLAQLRKDYK